MSAFTAERLARIDFEGRAARRLDNFAMLASTLDGTNALDWRPAADDVPLCYPLLARNGGRLRTRLADARIYCPVYWPGLDPGPGANLEQRLLLDLACLPIDHRYSADDMARILRVIDGFRD
jgi:hypothetical protein